MKKSLQFRRSLSLFMKISFTQVLLVVFFAASSYAHESKAQEFLNKSISLKVADTEVRGVLTQLEQLADVKFVYSTSAIQAKRKITLSATNRTLADVLDAMLNPLKIDYKVLGGKIMLINTEELPNFAVADQAITGKVADNKGAGLPGVSIAIKGTSRGTATDADGKFKLNANTGETIVFSFVGYTTEEVKFTGQNPLNVTLQESTSQLGEIVVVGSRSATARTNIESAVPVDVISTKELKGFSQVDVGQILNYVAPSFSSNRQTVSDGTDHLDPASLRGLGPDQVLVLVNGKRRHTSALVNINGTVGRGSVGTDMNAIPVAAIERIEVLRDGAAAQYGSDAIAGVINVVLKKNYEGFSASLTTGQHITTNNYTAPNGSGGVNSYSDKITDGQLLQFDLSKGFRLGKDGYLTVSGQYNNHEKTNRSGIDNIPTIYLGSNGSFPSTPTGQTATDFRNKIIAEDAAIAKQNGFDRHNMVFGNSSARNLGLFINGGIPTGKHNIHLPGIIKRCAAGSEFIIKIKPWNSCCERKSSC